MTNRPNGWLANGDPGASKILPRCGDDQRLNIRHLYLGTTGDNARDTVLMNRCPNQVVPLDVARAIARRHLPGKAGLCNGNTAQLSSRLSSASSARPSASPCDVCPTNH